MKLAVVIPAYKEAFLGKTLASLAAQTDSDFTVYVGDDASPFAIQEQVSAFSDRLRVRYTRFADNIGAKRLVEQWARCMTLLQDEEWVWFFSDDDLASPNCVETFRRRVGQTQGDVYRFNTCTIDENDRQLWPTVPSPDHESSEEMALNILLGRRGNSMPDHVFSREVYRRKGGFVSTPFAQAADWGTSILFSQEKGMHMLQEGLVSWRRGGASISHNVSRNRLETMRGHYCFIDWLLRHFDYLRREGPRHGVSYDQIFQAAMDNLRAVVVHHYLGMPSPMYAFHVRFMREHFGLSRAQAWRHLAGILAADFQRRRPRGLKYRVKEVLGFKV